VHLAPCDAAPGDFVTAEVTYAAPHHLVADKVVAVRRGRAAHEVTGVMLGMPTVAR
jgi:tRNA-2-methylthio-N6-dimethylallyladenosine synthase